MEGDCEERDAGLGVKVGRMERDRGETDAGMVLRERVCGKRRQGVELQTLITMSCLSGSGLFLSDPKG